jgi:signal transduction histidine kinase/diacylglycerol kinase family enzyme/DNA-binding NarL/FixJ family response regulator
LKTTRHSTLKLIIIIVATYAFFLVGIVWADSIDYSTAMHIDLTDPEVCEVFLREQVPTYSGVAGSGEAPAGVSRGNISEAEDVFAGGTGDVADENWVNLTGKTLSLGESELVKPYKQPMFTPTDLPVRYYTYQMKFNISPEKNTYIKDNVLVPGIYIEAIADNWEIFVNGNLIRREIYLDESGNIAVHRSVSAYSIPFDKDYLKEGENTLTFNIIAHPNTVDSGIYYNSEVYIDDIDAIEKANANFFLLFFTGITAFMGFYNLLVFFGNKEEKAYLYYSLVQFLLAVYIFTNTSWISVLILNTQITKRLEYISMTLLPILVLLFAQGVAKEKIGIFMRIVAAVQILIAVLLPFGGVQFSVDLLLLSEACMLISLFYGMITGVKWLTKTAKAENPEGRITLRGFTAVLFLTVLGNTFIGLLFVIVCAVFGVIRSTFLEADQNSVIVGLFAFVLAVSFSLQNEVTETKHKVLHQNEELEEKVASRTRDLEKQTEIAINASKTKSRFLATMSHEIRTPMNAIIGISEILKARSDLQTEVRSGIDKIHHSGKNLLGIINDILDLSKAETGKLEIVPTEFAFPSLINDTVQLNIVRIGSKPIKFTMSLSDNLPEKLIGDELRIKQILNNILSNAFKYTDKGSVNFDISGEKTDNGFMTIFTVSDTGQGMHEEELQTLFDEYSRFNKIANRKTEGAGLGMNITGQLISLMGGTIDVKSTFGKGSIFTVSIPLKAAPETAAISVDTRNKLCSFTFGEKEKIGERRKEIREFFPGKTVLVVDDVETNLYVAEGLLKPYKLGITTAMSGFEAIHLIKSGKTFDIIFMDHMMPEMDGIETVEKIRKMGYTLPIAALTANAIVGNEAIFKESGFDDFLSKPIDIRDLNRILVRFLRTAEPILSGELIMQNARLMPADHKTLPAEAVPPAVTSKSTEKTKPATQPAGASPLKHLFVINPKSFPERKEMNAFCENVKDILGDAASIIISRYPRYATSKVNSYLSEKTKKGEKVRVYAVGGDGILFDCLSGVLQYPESELASVPYGNANDFLRAFGSENAPVFRDIKLLSQSPSVSTDVFRCGANMALVNAAIGLEGSSILVTASMAKKLAKIPFLRKLIPTLYILGAVVVLFDKKLRSQYYQITLDDVDYSGEYIDINIGNCYGNGGSNASNPYAMPDDGYLDAIFIKKMPLLKCLIAVNAFTSGNFEKFPAEFFHVRFKKMFASSEEPIRIAADGEAFYTSEVSIEIHPKSVNIIAPEGIIYRPFKEYKK